MPGDESDRRQLAAVMFTDVVGFTALAHHDEALAIDLLGVHREILRPIFRQYEGREVKTMGDGFLVEFPSALAATHCALAIQRALVEYNASAPHDRRIQVRIGVHAGDIVRREGDIYGDGVNIASRIEQ
jgi:class 3 adenylate cyclase